MASYASLVEALLFGTGAARLEAADALPGAKSKDIRDWLDNNGDAAVALARALVDPETAVRLAATDVLEAFWRQCSMADQWWLTGRIHEEPGMAALLVRALEDPAPAVRKSAAVLLDDRSAIGAVDPLIALLSDHEGALRRQAVGTLGTLGDSRAIGPLLAALKDPEPGVRAAAASALCYKGPAPLGTDLRRVVQALIETLDDAESYVSGQAAAGLGSLRDPSAFEPLQRAIERGNTAAAVAMGRLRDARAIDVLVGVLKKPDPTGDMRSHAESGLSDLRSWLIEVMNDREEQRSTTARAAAALASMDDKEAEARPHVGNRCVNLAAPEGGVCGRIQLGGGWRLSWSKSFNSSADAFGMSIHDTQLTLERPGAPEIISPEIEGNLRIEDGGAMRLNDALVLVWDMDRRRPYLWDLTTGRMHWLGRDVGRVGGALAAPGGTVVAWSEAGSLVLWDLTATVPRYLQGSDSVHSEPGLEKRRVAGATILPDASLLTWSWNGDLRQWTLDRGACVATATMEEAEESHPDWLAALWAADPAFEPVVDIYLTL